MTSGLRCVAFNFCQICHYFDFVCIECSQRNQPKKKIAKIIENDSFCTKFILAFPADENVPVNAIQINYN